MSNTLSTQSSKIPTKESLEQKKKTAARIIQVCWSFIVGIILFVHRVAILHSITVATSTTIHLILYKPFAIVGVLSLIVAIVTMCWWVTLNDGISHEYYKGGRNESVFRDSSEVTS